MCPAPGYVNVGIPEEMIEKIKELLNNKIIKSSFPYRNPTELIRAATSEKIIELEKHLKQFSEKSKT